MPASIVQHVNSTTEYQGSALAFTLPAASTAGNLLILTFDDSNGNDDIPSGFTIFGAAVGMYGGDRTLQFAYKVSAGETTITGGSTGARGTLYEVAGAGDPTTFEVRSVDDTTSSTKSLGDFITPGDLQIARFAWNSSNEDQVAGTGYTQDDSAHLVAGFNPQACLAEHSLTGATPQITGLSYRWCGMAVGITAGSANPSADFSGTPRSGPPSLSVDFTDLSTGTGIDTWDWDFGDGSTHGTTQNPTHVYTDPGYYDVSLTVTGDDGSDSVTKIAYIHVTIPGAAGVYIDWDDDGFDTGTHDNVSADVVSWVITRGAAAEITGSDQPGSCTLTLQNRAELGVAEDNLYNPAKTTGALYGKLRDGVPIWIGVNSDGKLSGPDPRGLFAGRIVDITPLPSAGVPPTVEITCEDMLGWAQRKRVQILFVEGAAQDDFRRSALVNAGETNFSLDHEIQTMPLANADNDLASVLADLNSVTGTRHFIEPADNFTDWYTYRTRNRFWRLDGTTDASLDAGSDHVTSSDGWRLSADTVINEQKATVEPIIFTPGSFIVWTADPLPFDVTDTKPYTRWVDFDDVVRDPILNIASTGATVVAALTGFGASALVELTVASGTATISALAVEGRLVRRLPSESVVVDDTTSQADPRGVRAGSEITSPYLGVIAEAQGIAGHVVWRYANPQFRPTLTAENWFPDQFDRDLLDVLAFTSTGLAVSARHFEIVGLKHQSDIAADDVQHHTAIYVLQESRVQSAPSPGWFTWDSSTWDGGDVWHY